MPKKINLKGKKFERLLVMSESSNRNRSGSVNWICECDCGNIVVVEANSLRSGNTRSCGCLRDEILKKKKVYNQYNLTGNFGIGYTSKMYQYYFDKEDYDIIKKYAWGKDGNGYVIASSPYPEHKTILMHRIIMNMKDKKMFIDHINRVVYDNRKCNLRIVSPQENCYNKNMLKNNTSGIMGVRWIKNRKKWRVSIKNKTVGEFVDFDKAIYVRLKAEKKYFKEFSPQQHLFKKYGIGIE